MRKNLLLLFFGLNSILFSQINIEKYNNINNNYGLSGSTSFYISAKTGNTDIQEFGLDARINYERDKYFTFLVGQGEYGWNKGKEYSNNALIHFRYIRKIDKIINPEVFIQMNYNKSRLLNFRTLAGGGVRLSVISDSVTSLNAGSAYMYEYEKLDLPEDAKHPEETNYHRWSNYINYSRHLSDKARISIVIYAQPRFDNLSDLRLLSENHLSVGLSERFSLSINLNLQYDSKPPDGVKDLDTKSKLGFTFSL